MDDASEWVRASEWERERERDSESKSGAKSKALAAEVQTEDGEICIWPTFLFLFQKKLVCRGKHNLHSGAIIARDALNN